ncbi:MAG: hypothetical protein M3A44_03930 [Gammaproteobacteria bacterium]
MSLRSPSNCRLSLTALGVALVLAQSGCASLGKPAPAPLVNQSQAANQDQSAQAAGTPVSPVVVQRTPQDEVLLAPVPVTAMPEPLPLTIAPDGVAPVELAAAAPVPASTLSPPVQDQSAQATNMPPPQSAIVAPGQIEQAPSVASMKEVGQDGAPVSVPAPVPSVVAAPTQSLELLQPWEIIRGGPEGNFIAGVRELSFVRPIAVAARGNTLFVMDAGQDMLFRYERATGRLTPVMNLTGVMTGDGADIYVARDLSFYIADTFGARVLQFDRKGRLLRTFSNPLNMTRPVSVTVDEPSGRVFVADGVYDYVLVFNSMGQLTGSMGGRGGDPGEFLNITAMAQGPDGFYVTARVGQHIQVLGEGGQYSYSLPQEGIIFPTAIAVDQDNRVFVSDFSDGSIKVYEQGRLAASVGHPGSGLGQFRHVTDLWFDEGLLFVADSLNGRVQVMRVAPGTKGQNTN